jgi:hypothetical protein
VIEHPNEANEPDETMVAQSQDQKKYYKWSNSALVNWFNRFDAQTLQPVFLRKKARTQKATKDDDDDHFKQSASLKSPPKKNSH